VDGSSLSQVKIRHFFGNVAIRLQSVAGRAARQRRTNKLEGEDTPGVNRKAQRSFVRGVGSKPQYPSSRVATGRFIARTATSPRREAVPSEEVAEVTVKTAWSGQGSSTKPGGGGP